MPALPIGKLHPTPMVINSRFVFQIGGFDDFNFDIYRLDMKNPNRPWRTLSLDLEKPIIQPNIFLGTQEFLEKLIEQKSRALNKNGEDDSDEGIAGNND